MSAYNLQIAVYDAVAAAVAPVPVYDNPQQVANPDDNSQFPFVTVGEATLNSWDDDTLTGFDADIVIHVWSRASHRLETKELQDTIYSALNRASLTVGSNPVVLCDHVQSDTMRDPDGITIHGVSRYRIVWTP